MTQMKSRADARWNVACVIAVALALAALPLLADEKRPAQHSAPAPSARPQARPAGPQARPATPNNGSRGAAPNVRPNLPGVPGRPASVPRVPGVPAHNPFSGRPEGPRVGPVVRPGGFAHAPEIRRNGIIAREGPLGRRQVLVERPGGVRVMSYGRSAGYVQRPFVYHNQQFVGRTYVVGGRAYVRAYRPVIYHGVTVSVYAPAHFYTPAFYTFAYRPWGPIVYTGWGWGAAPWYPMYGAYLVPAAVYPAPSFWLADFMMAAAFQAAYQAQMDAANAAAANAANANAMVNSFTAPVSPALRQDLSNEIQNGLQQEQTQAQMQAGPDAPLQPAANTLPILDSRVHTLQVYTSMNVTSSTGTDCSLTEGDVVKFNGAPPADGVNALANVVYTKAQDCPVSTTVSLPVDQLQEMSNHMMEIMEQGLEELQHRQGQNGLPSLTPAMMTSTLAPYAEAIPSAEPDVQAEIAAASTQGAALLSEAAPGQAAPGQPLPAPAPQPSPYPQPTPSLFAPPATQSPTGKIDVGMSPQDVVASWGQPSRTAMVGNKLIYFYKDSKVTFENGKLTGVD